jgi:hypothetical protein
MQILVLLLVDLAFILLLSAPLLCTSTFSAIVLAMLALCALQLLYSKAL